MYLAGKFPSSTMYTALCVCRCVFQLCTSVWGPAAVFFVLRVPERFGQCQSTVRAGRHEAQLRPAACPRWPGLHDEPRQLMNVHFSALPWQPLPCPLPSPLHPPHVSYSEIMFMPFQLCWSACCEETEWWQRKGSNCDAEAYLFPSSLSSFFELKWKISEGWKLIQLCTSQCFKIILVTWFGKSTVKSVVLFLCSENCPSWLQHFATSPCCCRLHTSSYQARRSSSGASLMSEVTGLPHWTRKNDKGIICPALTAAIKWTGGRDVYQAVCTHPQSREEV